MNAATADWREQIFETLSAHDIRQVYYVPDAGHSKLIEMCQTSNAMRAIVLTTGNKSELAVGYCTLYGDMCGGLAVISDVPKTLVYALSHVSNRRHNDANPASVFVKGRMPV